MEILFQSGIFPIHFSVLKKFSGMVIPGGGFFKRIIIQGVQLKHRLSCGRWSCLRRKGGVTVASFHETRQRNSLCRHIARGSIYKTRRPKQPHSPILQSTMTLMYPFFMYPLHEILTWHISTVYVCSLHYMSLLFVYSIQSQLLQALSLHHNRVQWTVIYLKQVLSSSLKVPR